jgi:glycerol-3-phosphate acyltransferase PlsY
VQEPWFYALWTAGAYLLGSISTGDVVARIAGADIRALGTGNPGTANIYREVGRAQGVAVFALDFTKGAVATVPLYLLGLPTWTGLMATAAVITGHLFPILWRLRGGTGLVVAMGASAGLLPAGALAGATATALAAAVIKDLGYAGAVFFVVAALVGGVVHQDAVGVIGVLLAGTAIFIKARVQYHHR